MTDGPVDERLFNDKDTAKLNKVNVDILKQFLNTSRFKRANLPVTFLSSAETVHSFPDLPAAHLPRGFGRRAGAGTFTGARERRGSERTRQRVQRPEARRASRGTRGPRGRELEAPGPAEAPGRPAPFFQGGRVYRRVHSAHSHGAFAGQRVERGPRLCSVACGFLETVSSRLPVHEREGVQRLLAPLFMTTEPARFQPRDGRFVSLFVVLRLARRLSIR